MSRIRVTVFDALYRMSSGVLRNGKPRECYFCGADCGEAFSTITNLHEHRMNNKPKAVCVKCTLRIEEARDTATQKVDHEDFKAWEINPATGELFRRREAAV